MISQREKKEENNKATIYSTRQRLEAMKNRMQQLFDEISKEHKKFLTNPLMEQQDHAMYKEYNQLAESVSRTKKLLKNLEIGQGLRNLFFKKYHVLPTVTFTDAGNWERTTLTLWPTSYYNPCPDDVDKFKNYCFGLGHFLSAYHYREGLKMEDGEHSCQITIGHELVDKVIEKLKAPMSDCEKKFSKEIFTIENENNIHLSLTP